MKKKKMTGDSAVGKRNGEAKQSEKQKVSLTLFFAFFRFVKNSFRIC